MITAEIQQADIARLNAMTRKAKRGAEDAIDTTIRRLTILAVQSAAKATPLAKNRKVNKVASWSKAKRKAEGAPWWAEYRIAWYAKSGDLEPRWASSKQTADTLRRPKYRGAAKAGWWKPIRNLGGVPKGPVASRVDIRRVVGTLQQQKIAGNLRSVIVTNKIDYIQKVAPNAAQIGLANAAARFEATEKRRIQSAIIKAAGR